MGSEYSLPLAISAILIALAPRTLEEIDDGKNHEDNDQDIKNWSDVHDGILPNVFGRENSPKARAKAYTPSPSTV